MKPGVPNTMPARVLMMSIPAWLFAMLRLSPVRPIGVAGNTRLGTVAATAGSSASPISFASPQSITIVSPSSPTRMFDGLMSRWTIPRSCACAIACAEATMCGNRASRCGKVSAVATRRSSGRPEILRMT